MASTVKKGYNFIKTYVGSGPKERQQMRKEVVESVDHYVEERYPTAYEKAKKFGKATYDWGKSKLKEAGNIYDSWTESMEETVKHFCTTANRVKKGVVEFAKNVDWKKVAIAGIVIVGGVAITVATAGTGTAALAAIAGKTVLGSAVGGIAGGVQSYVTGGDVKQGILSGIVTGGIAGLGGELLGATASVGAYMGVNAIAGVTGSLTGSVYKGESITETVKHALQNGAIQGITGGGLAGLGAQAGLGNTVVDRIAEGVIEYTSTVGGIGIGATVDALDK